MIRVLESDISKLLEDDRQKQQAAFNTLEDLYDLLEYLYRISVYNGTEGIWSEQEVNETALKAAIKIIRINDLVISTHAYSWSIAHGANSTNNYTYRGKEYYLIYDMYPALPYDIPAFNYWLLEIFGGPPEILQVDLFNWELELYNDTSIIYALGSSAFLYSGYYNIDLIQNSYYNIMSEASTFSSQAEYYNQGKSIMTTSLILMTISAVIIAFIVSIDVKKYILISMVIGILVSMIAIYMFVLAIPFV